MRDPRILVTVGDPCGCGPQIVLQSIYALRNSSLVFYVVADQRVLVKSKLYSKLKKRIILLDPQTKNIGLAGKLKPKSELAGLASLNYLKLALKTASELKIKRLVTAPISKEAVSLVLPNFSGHTEYLAAHYKVKQVAMLMWSEALAVALFTRHIRLNQLFKHLKTQVLCDFIKLVNQSLKNNFKLANPRIAFAAVNPHAGVDTFFGAAEKTIFSAIEKSGCRVAGPLPADTVFTLDNLKHFDCIICSYHDQAMIPFKLLAIRQGVNVTLGLPIIRTSCAHGVAYQLIAQAKEPFFSSMLAAIKLAVKLEV